MQIRKPESGIIRVTQLNDIFNAEENFLLFSLLSQNTDKADYQAGEVYTVNETTVTLSHTVEPIDNKLFTPAQAYSVLNANGEVMGDLHLLSIGMIYYRETTEMRARLSSLKSFEILQQLINEKIRLYSKNETNFKHPIVHALHYLLDQLQKVDEKDLALLEQYGAFIVFYLSSLTDAMNWKPLRVVATPFTLPAHKVATLYLQFTKDTDIFFAGEQYYFQNNIIKFTATIVRRQRKNNKGECFDCLSENKLGSGATSLVYSVDGVFVKDRSKVALRHPYVYKISQLDDLLSEFEATKTLEHLAKSRNYHPGLYSMPNFGKCLTDHLQKNILKFSGALFVRLVLKLHSEVYRVAADQLKGKYHGDLKHDNFCIDRDDKINVIDFTGGKSFTVCNASPELLSEEMSERVKMFLSENQAKLPGHLTFHPLNFLLDDNGFIHLLDEKTKKIIETRSVYNMLHPSDADCIESFLMKAKVRVISDTRRRKVSDQYNSVPSKGEVISFKNDEEVYVVNYSLFDMVREKMIGTEKSDVYSLARMMADIWGDEHGIWSHHTNFLYIFDSVVMGTEDRLLQDLINNIFGKYSEQAFPREVLADYKEAFLKCHARNPEDRPSMLEAAEMFHEIYRKYLKLTKKSEVGDNKVRLRQ